MDLLFIFSFKANAFCVAVETGLLISEVLFTFPNPTLVALIPEAILESVTAASCSLVVVIAPSAILAVVIDWSDSLIVVTEKSASLIEVMALLATVGFGYLPERSPPAKPEGAAVPAVTAVKA